MSSEARNPPRIVSENLLYRMHSGRRVGGRYDTLKPVQNAFKQKNFATADPSPPLFFTSPPVPFHLLPRPLEVGPLTSN